jgi:hypothetical protein
MNVWMVLHYQRFFLPGVKGVPQKKLCTGVKFFIKATFGRLTNQWQLRTRLLKAHLQHESVVPGTLRCCQNALVAVSQNEISAGRDVIDTKELAVKHITSLQLRTNKVNQFDIS